MKAAGGGNPIRVALVDDHSLVRRGIKSLLDTQPDIQVVAEAGSGQEALEACHRVQPHIVVMDLRLPDMSGTEVTSRLRQCCPECRVIVLTMYEGDEDILRAFRAGAKAYLLKAASQDQFAEVVRAVAAGSYSLPPDITAKLLRRMNEPELSARELEVLRMIAEGLSNKEIADALNVAESTIKNHVKAILEKLRVNDRTGAAIAAVQLGLVHL